MTTDQLRFVLDEQPEDVRDRVATTPAWLEELHRAFSRRNCTDRQKLSGVIPSHPMAPLLDLAQPLIDDACQRLIRDASQLLDAHRDAPFDAGEVDQLLGSSLAGTLLDILGRALALELNIARLEGTLKGESPQDRFASFARLLRDPERALAFFHDYPVLARQAVLSTNMWLTTSLEFLQHLCIDWPAIRSRFELDRGVGRLVSVDGGMGDTHKGGRSVLSLRFSSGFGLVYKPRSLAADDHFQQLLRWINQRSKQPSFRTLNLIDCGNHGWVEFVDAETCNSPQAVHRFYMRLGGYLALFYLLRASDLHYENLIAAGEHPVVVDLETLFQPSEPDIVARDVTTRALLSSVLATGLLPQRVWATPESEGLDLSGMGGEAGQRSPARVPVWQRLGTDEMRLTREYAGLHGARNRPTLNGAAVASSEHVNAIVEGFESLYRMLLNHRDELLSAVGPLAQFSRDEVRVVVRNTRTYGELLAESFHPDVLRNALDRDILFDRLWARAVHMPEFARLVPAEVTDLLNGDIPLFSTRAESRDLWTSTGERIADVFRDNGYDLTLRRLLTLSERDLAFQTWIVRASIGTGTGAEDRLRSTSRTSDKDVPFDPRRALAQACGIGDRLLALGVQGDGDVSWIGLRHSSGNSWSLVPFGPDLGAGLAGVTLFLAYLGAITGHARYTDTARAALRGLQGRIDLVPRLAESVGGFIGYGGVIYCLSHLAQLWNEPSLLAQADSYVSRMLELAVQDQQLDVIGGAAGAILGLLSLYRASPCQNTLVAAMRCGDVLSARAIPTQPGMGLPPLMKARGPLTGFSHGAAGAACALFELAGVTSETHFRDVAMQLVEYERHLFSAHRNNWPDLRLLDAESQPEPDGQPNFMVAWCHGAPGVGLSRLRMLRHATGSDSAMLQEVRAALESTLSAGFGANHSLCHGDLGNLELVLQAAELIGEPWAERSQRLAASIVSDIETTGWRCGNPGHIESPDLLTGLAGIGYGLLRIAEPARVPPVLTLAPSIDLDRPKVR